MIPNLEHFSMHNDNISQKHKHNKSVHSACNSMQHIFPASHAKHYVFFFIIHSTRGNNLSDKSSFYSKRMPVLSYIKREYFCHLPATKWGKAFVTGGKLGFPAYLSSAKSNIFQLLMGAHIPLDTPVHSSMQLLLTCHQITPHVNLDVYTVHCFSLVYLNYLPPILTTWLHQYVMSMCVRQIHFLKVKVDL